MIAAEVSDLRGGGLMARADVSNDGVVVSPRFDFGGGVDAAGVAIGEECEKDFLVRCFLGDWAFHLQHCVVDRAEKVGRVRVEKRGGIGESTCFDHA